MKTLFSRILMAQVVAIVLALLVAALITRVSLTHGFERFLERQETTVLETIAPALGDVYLRQGNWDFLRDKPNNWQRIWRLSRNSAGGPPGGGPARPGPGEPAGRLRDMAQGPAANFELRWLAQPGRGALRDRLFLLDENKEYIAGAETGILDSLDLQELEAGGQVIGWIGFAPAGSALPPDAQRFLNGQVRIMFLALSLALLVAALLAWVLARNVSRPVQRLAGTVRQLSEGRYEARVLDTGDGELAVLATRINRLAESLQKNSTARKRWMADIAHELRTPIAVLKGEIEAISDGVRPIDANTTASLNEEINHLASMVDDLQALALADAGALNLQVQPIDIADMLRMASDAFTRRLAEKGVTLKMELQESPTIDADPQRIRQLLHNLLENCSRYTEKGGTVRIQLHKGDGVVLNVDDSGPGVSEEQRAHLFDRFYRAEGSRSRATGGSGLGLSNCKNISEAHGGSIEAGHSPLGGLSIRVHLPA